MTINDLFLLPADIADAFKNAVTTLQLDADNSTVGFNFPFFGHVPGSAAAAAFTNIDRDFRYIISERIPSMFASLRFFDPGMYVSVNGLLSIVTHLPHLEGIKLHHLMDEGTATWDGALRAILSMPCLRVFAAKLDCSPSRSFDCLLALLPEVQEGGGFECELRGGECARSECEGAS